MKLTWENLKKEIGDQALTSSEIAAKTGWKVSRVSYLCLVMFEAGELERRKSGHSHSLPVLWIYSKTEIKSRSLSEVEGGFPNKAESSDGFDFAQPTEDST